MNDRLGFEKTWPGGARVAAAVGLLLLALMVGCAGVGKRLQPPRVQIAGIQLRQVKGLEAVFQVDLRVMNGNETAVEIRGVDCSLEINGEPFATGVSRTGVKIDSFETEVVPVTVYSSVVGMVRGLFDVQTRKALSYRIAGRVQLGAGAIPSVIPFSAEGTLSPEMLRR
jgi:LEA14-like dessication related protein